MNTLRNSNDQNMQESESPDEMSLDEFMDIWQGNYPDERREEIRLQLQDENSPINKWLNRVNDTSKALIELLCSEKDDR